MNQWNTENLIYIMAPKGYARKSIESKGIRAFSPYYGDNLPQRLFREVCFRIPFLPKTIWYNKAVLIDNVEYIIIVDVNITRHYVKWVQKHFPMAQINFLYDNMVGKARNISPFKIPEGIRIWTYDDYDSRKYRIRLLNNYWANPLIKRTKKEPEFDVFFVGADKGRGSKLLAFQQQLINQGLKTKFIITKSKKFSRRKKYYQEPISYKQVLENDSKSRAILNMTMENQEGVTMRDIESAVMGIKLITTNRNIVNKDLYSRKNVFILGVDRNEDLKNFLYGECEDIWETIKDRHTFEIMMNEITM